MTHPFSSTRYKTLAGLAPSIASNRQINKTTAKQMSKLYSFRTQGYSLQAYGPDSVEEYDKVAGGPGKCLEDAVDNEIFRGTIPAFWKAAIPKVAELTGIALGTDEKATEKARQRAKTPEAAAAVKNVDEKFSSYITRVEASLGDDKDAHKELEELLKSVALETAIDPSPSNRERGPGKDYLDKADKVLALSDDQIEEKVSKWTAIAGWSEADLSRDENGKPERESLAKLAKATADALLAA